MEHRSGATGRVLEHFQRSVEGNASGQQLLPGVGTEADTLRPDGQIDSPGIPETGLGMNQSIMRSADECGDAHALVVRR